MQHEPHFEVRTSQVVEQLPRGCFGQLARRLAFYDHFVIDKHVQPLPSHLFAFVEDADENLPGDVMASPAQFKFQRPHVDRFEKAVPELVVNFVKGTDNRSRELRVQQV